MPTIKSGPGGAIYVSTPDLGKKIANLPETIRVATFNATKEIARKHRDVIQGGLRSGSLGLRGFQQTSTVRTRLFGKTPGNFPGRARTTRTQPLVSSGVSVAAIRVKIRSTAIIEVNYADGAMMPYSREPMEKIAALQEQGYNRKVTYTKKMLAFLHMMFRKKGKVASNESRGKARVGYTYTEKVESRPAWDMARRIVRPMVRPTVDRHVSIALSGLGLTSK